MAKTRPQFQVSRFNGGINRYLADDVSNDCPAEALDCVVDEGGDLHRRLAFKSVVAGPVHLLPPQRSIVVTSADGSSGSAVTNRVPTYTAFNSSNDIYVGGLDAFDGIQWPEVTNSAGTPSSHKRLQVAYWNSGLAQWVTIPFILETTTTYRAGENYSEPLGRGGHIHWHPSQLSNWGSRSIAGYSRLWVRLRIVDLSGSKVTPQQQWACKSPGVMTFTREPVSAIIPATLRGAPFVILGADRISQPGRRSFSSLGYTPKNLEAGAALSAWRIDGRSPQPLDVTRRFASGTWDQVTTPTSHRSDLSGSTTPVGTTGNIVDQCQGKAPPWTSPEQYSYQAEPPWGSIVADAIAPTSGLSASAFTTTDARLLSYPTGAFRDYYLLSAGSGAIATNDIRRISNFTNGGSSVTFTVDNADGALNWALAPNTSDRFTLLAPPCLFKIAQTGAVHEPNKVGSATTIAIETKGYAAAPADYMSAGLIHFEVLEQLRYTVQAGRFWTGVVDTPYNRVLLSNGMSPLLEFDGRSLKRTAADTTSLLAAKIAGTNPAGTDLATLGAHGTISDTLRSSPPVGKYLCRWGGRLCVAGGSSGKDLIVSAPGDYNNIWRWWDSYQLNDSQQDTQITALFPLYDRLCVFTQKAVFEATPDPTTGGGLGLSLRQVVQGTGTFSHQSVVEVPLSQGPALVWPIGSGIVGYANGQIFDLLQFWESVLPGGVNTARLERAVSVHWRERNACLFAVAQGSSDYNNRIVYWDYARNRFWVWTAPFGISSMSTVTTSDGHEHVLFGTDDGFVQTLVLADTDDGNAITATVRSRPVQLFEASHASLRRLNFSISPLGYQGTVNYSIYLEESDDARTSGSFPIDTGRATYGRAVYGTDRYAGETIKTHSVNLPNGTKGKRVQLQVSWTSPLIRLRNSWIEADQLSTGRK